ncbi:hypothetical protein ACK345_04805 [Aeromonas rivipollensis]|uniref:hypothetical protein n=1 Tax=Aeromonas rivipollensis TaxID=948519 RepID=UPI003987A3BE
MTQQPVLQLARQIGRDEAKGGLGLPGRGDMDVGPLTGHGKAEDQLSLAWPTRLRGTQL